MQSRHRPEESNYRNDEWKYRNDELKHRKDETDFLSRVGLHIKLNIYNVLFFLSFDLEALTEGVIFYVQIKTVPKNDPEIRKGFSAINGSQQGYCKVCFGVS